MERLSMLFNGQYPGPTKWHPRVPYCSRSNQDLQYQVYLPSGLCYTPSLELTDTAKYSTTGSPKADNGPINGTMKHPKGTPGVHNQIHVEKGQRYRLCVINTGSNDHYHFLGEKHNLTVIASDVVPLVPFTTSFISLGVGEGPAVEWAYVLCSSPRV